MIHLSPRQQAAVDQARADIRECRSDAIEWARDNEHARLLALEILDDIIDNPPSAWASMLAWKELLEQCP